MRSEDFDMGAVDGNENLSPFDPDNPEYMAGYEEGQRLADLGIPYIPLYSKIEKYLNHKPELIWLQKDTYAAAKAALKEGEDLSDLIEKLLQEYLR